MKKILSALLLTSVLIAGCTEVETETINTNEETKQEVVQNAKQDISANQNTEQNTEKEDTQTTSASKPTKDELFKGYKLIEVDACDTSGHREANVVVDISYGTEREYLAFTNEHGQLVRVIADEIILQDDNSEPVTSQGRYCADEAKVPGVESSTLDEGHVIADSLGGNSSAYNITPQNSTLNRNGDQAYMEDAIRKAGGATDFEAIITYPNTETQIPSHYKYTYTIKGNKIVDEFDNGNPDETNKSLGLTTKPSNSSKSNTEGDLASVDTNGDGKVTIAEAKAAGYTMPIKKGVDWLYPYMQDNDNDGVVGE